MQGYVYTDGNIKYTLGKQLASHGEGSVYEIDGQTVAKIYHEEKRLSYGINLEKKIQYMTEHKIEQPANLAIEICWPEKVLYDQDRNFCGYTMKKEEGYCSFYKFCKKTEQELNWFKRLYAAYLFSAAIYHLHQNNVFLHDFTDNNFLYREADGNLVFVDCGQYLLADRDHRILDFGDQRAYNPKSTAPEQYQDLIPDSFEAYKAWDNYYLALNIFRLLTFGRASLYDRDCSQKPDSPGAGCPADEAVKNGICLYVKNIPNECFPDKDNLIPPGVFPTDILALFYKTFNYTAETVREQRFQRADAKEWWQVLWPYVDGSTRGLKLKRCCKNPNHIYSSHLETCPWCNLKAVSRMSYEERMHISGTSYEDHARSSKTSDEDLLQSTLRLMDIDEIFRSIEEASQTAENQERQAQKTVGFHNGERGTIETTSGRTASGSGVAPASTRVAAQMKKNNAASGSGKSSAFDPNKNYVTIETVGSSVFPPSRDQHSITNIGKRYKVSIHLDLPSLPNGDKYDVRSKFQSPIFEKQTGKIKTTVSARSGEKTDLNEIELVNKANEPVWLFPTTASAGAKSRDNEISMLSDGSGDLWYALESKDVLSAFFRQIRKPLVFVLCLILAFLIAFFVGQTFFDEGKDPAQTGIAAEDMTDADYKAFYQKSLKAFQAGLKKGAYSSVLCTTDKINCLCKDGTVKVFGDYANADHEYSGKYSDWEQIRSIAVMYDGNLAGLKEDGTVVADGKMFPGTVDTGKWSDIVQIDTLSGALLYGLKSDGSVVYSPTKTKAFDAQLESFNYVSGCKKISSIETFNLKILGVKSDGSIVSNFRDDDLFYYGGVPTSRKLSKMQNAEDFVVSGTTNIVCLTKEGSVVYIGAESYSDDTYLFDENTLDTWTDIKSLSAGWGHIVALRADGTVAATGINEFGQCDVDKWKKIVKVEAYNNTTVGYCKNGSIVIAGYNPLEELVSSYD